jgi:HPt (histidine-containing phosphotransfer) domain-containing protein
MARTMSIIDLAPLDRLSASPALEQQGALAGLIESYLADAPRVLAYLEAAAACGDGTGLREMAQRLRGSSGIFGATKLCDALHEAETIGTAHDAAEMTRWLARVTREYAQVSAALSLEYQQRGA